MFNLKKGNIVPKQGIGNLMLGMSFDEIKSIVKDFEIDERSGAFVVVCEDVKLWIDNETMKCTQILVRGDFTGKFNNTIGLGMTLGDIEKLGYEWYEDLYAYFIKGIDGIGFELADIDDDEDNDEWDALIVPIAYISVFND